MSTSLRSWASALGGTVSGASILCAGPGHSRKDRSLAVRLSASAPDGFLVYSHAGDDFADCRDFVRAKLGLPAFTPQRSPLAAVPGAWPDIPQSAPQTDEEIGRSSMSRRIWNGTIKVRGTIVEAYLASRGLTLPDDVVDIRFHPMCPFESERVPAMVAAMRDIRTDEIVGVHRTRHSADGQKLGRKMLGKASNAAIKIDANEHVTVGVVIGEGIETCLAARRLGFQPTWALGSAGAITSFPVLSGIEALTILAETGAASQRAVDECGSDGTKRAVM